MIWLLLSPGWCSEFQSNEGVEQWPWHQESVLLELGLAEGKPSRVTKAEASLHLSHLNYSCAFEDLGAWMSGIWVTLLPTHFPEFISYLFWGCFLFLHYILTSLWVYFELSLCRMQCEQVCVCVYVWVCIVHAVCIRGVVGMCVCHACRKCICSMCGIYSL